ncbi:MAG: COX15/CtaA family protein [Mycobacteriales bacterium]
MPNAPGAAYGNLLTRIRTTPTSPRTLRVAALAAIVANAGIVVTGGAVRLSNSGLGCPTWPDCTDGRLLPGGANTHSAGHQGIEFGNRLLGILVLATAVLMVLAAWRARPRRRRLFLMSWWLPAGFLAQAVLGGITVRAKLNPLVVAPHFLLSMVLVFVAVWIYCSIGEGDAPARPLVRRELGWGVRALVVIVAAVEVVGTLVTATGPHAGDPGTKRLAWDARDVTQFHADLVFLYVGIVLALLLGFIATGAPAVVRRRSVELIGVILVQAAIGYVQYFLHVPAVLVAFHMAGATLATIATARLYFATRTRGSARPDGASEPRPGRSRERILAP